MRTELKKIVQEQAYDNTCIIHDCVLFEETLTIDEMIEVSSYCCNKGYGHVDVISNNMRLIQRGLLDDWTTETPIRRTKSYDIFPSENIREDLYRQEQACYDDEDCGDNDTNKVNEDDTDWDYCKKCGEYLMYQPFFYDNATAACNYCN